jgi:sphinganine-1-phosphate aldolase
MAQFISSVLGGFGSNASDFVGHLDSQLEEISPTCLILTTATACIAYSTLNACYHKGWGMTGREKLGALALRLPCIKERYSKDIQKELVHFQGSVREKWEQFLPLITTIPENGWDQNQLLNLVERYSRITSEHLKGKHLSGTIYSKNLDKGYQSIPPAFRGRRKFNRSDSVDDDDFFEHLSQKLETVFTHAFSRSYLWNSLHGDEFSVGACIDYQVVRMVAEMFGGAPNEVMGFVTCGGTESLMLSMRSYRDWGVKNRGHEPGEGVIIASEFVHAAILKAGEAYSIKVELVETSADGSIDLQKLEKAVKKHGDKVIVIVGSAPNYPTGAIDPIAEMARIARDNHCGMHVDSCLGAFIINNLDNDEGTDYLNLPGVTSLSADTHKNGMAPKGSSVLVTKKMGQENLAYYSIYSLPGWKGGVYGTPKDAGSQSCVQSLNALLALLGTGKDGYRRISERIQDVTLEFVSEIESLGPNFEVIGWPEINVVAFKISEEAGLQKGATCAFAHEMAKRNFVLNILSDDTVHFCITLRFASDRRGIDHFLFALDESFDAVVALNSELTQNGKKFPGDAGMYCALEAAMVPDSKTMPVSKFVENVLLGQHGAKDAVRAYFLAQLDPYLANELV